MNNGFSPSRRAWNRVMTILVWASAVLVMILVAGIIGMVLVLSLIHILQKGLPHNAVRQSPGSELRSALSVYWGCLPM